MNLPSEAELRQQILDALYERYLKDNRVSGTWRFSDCGYLGMDGYCRRKRVLKFHGIHGIVTDNQKRVFLRGHMAEGIMLESLRLKFPNIVYQPFPEGIEYKIPGRPDIRFAGRTDFIVLPDLIIDGKNISVDARLTDAREGHKCQVMLTMAGLKQMFGTGYDPTGMVYYQREGRAFDIAPFYVHYNTQMIQILAQEVVELQDKYGGLIPALPDRNPDMQAIEGCTDPVKYPCSWWSKKEGRLTCDYFRQCWPNFTEPPKVRKTPTRRRRTT